MLRNRILVSIVACTAWFNLCESAFMAMLVVFLPRDMGMTPGAIGLLFVFFGAGGIAGAFLTGPVTRRLGAGRTIWISILVSAPPMLLVPSAEPGWQIWLGGVGLVVLSLGAVVYNVTQVSFRQRLTPDRLLGRMNATVRFVVWGVFPIGSLAGGALGSLFGARTTLWIGAAAACLAFLPVFFSPLRNMRDLPHPEPEPAAV